MCETHKISTWRKRNREREREIERDRETGNKRERHQLVNLFDPAVVIEHLFWFSAQVV